MKKESADKTGSLQDRSEETMPCWEKPEIRQLPVGQTKGGAMTTKSPGDDIWYRS